MEVAWNQLDPRLRGVDGLDDIMRFDLQHFCRRMQPPDEPHHRWASPSIPWLNQNIPRLCIANSLCSLGQMHVKLRCTVCMYHSLTQQPILDDYR